VKYAWINAYRDQYSVSRICRNNDCCGKVRVTTTLLWPTMKKSATPRKLLAVGVKRLHYPLDVMLLCVRWYVVYSLSLRDLEEMMAERAIGVDHSTVHRWAIKRRT